MTDDMALVREYARSGSEEAFAALVKQHINLVYSVALRRVHDPHLAEEITQAVFIVLARKAASLGPGTILSGWLCRTARYASANALTIQQRRRRREQEASMQSPSTESESESVAWTEIAPLLDDALGALAEPDHSAITLRFLEGRNLKQVGVALGISEDTARMRVNRAVEKLRKFFVKRGITLSAAVIAGAVSAKSVQAAPVALANSVTAVAVAKGAAAGGSTLAMAKGALKLMAWTKAKMVIAVGVGALLAVGTSTVMFKEIQKGRTYAWRVKQFSFPQICDQVPPQATILPSKFPDFFRSVSEIGGDARHIGLGAPFPTLMQGAFQVRHGDRMILPTDSPPGKYDYIANARHGASAALQREIKLKLGMTGQFETMPTDSLLLRVKGPGSPGLKLSAGGSRWSELGNGGFSDTNELMSAFAVQLEEYVFRIPVIDQTGLTNAYDINLAWQYPDAGDLKKQLLDQLGLELVPTNLPVEMLVVKRAQ